MTTIEGEVAAGFEPVCDAFAANLSQHGDIGAVRTAVGRRPS